MQVLVLIYLKIRLIHFLLIKRQSAITFKKITHLTGPGSKVGTNFLDIRYITLSGEEHTGHFILKHHQGKHNLKRRHTSNKSGSMGLKYRSIQQSYRSRRRAVINQNRNRASSSACLCGAALICPPSRASSRACPASSPFHHHACPVSVPSPLPSRHVHVAFSPWVLVGVQPAQAPFEEGQGSKNLTHPHREGPWSHGDNFALDMNQTQLNRGEHCKINQTSNST